MALFSVAGNRRFHYILTAGFGLWRPGRKWKPECWERRLVRDTKAGTALPSDGLYGRNSIALIAGGRPD
jgi:hypothetical protein